jgi:hypothetical protein
LTRKIVVALVTAAIVLGACTRSSSNVGNATPLQVYTAGPSLTQVRTTLGSSMWWPGAPSFGVRPLDLEQTPQNVRFTVTQHFTHLGSAETFDVDYTAFDSVSSATTRMSNIQSALGSSVITTPKVGDQVIYYGVKEATSTALFDTVVFVRLGPIVATADLTQASGFASINLLSRIGNLVVTGLKNVLAGKTRPSPLPSDDEALLPPADTYLTLVGAAKLPVEVVPIMLQSAAPEALAQTFHALGVSDFVYGDYALNADLHMEVRASVFTFATATDAGAWIDGVIGKSNLDANGVASQYLDPLKQYIAIFIAGSHIGILTCGSTAVTEAASRACETPLTNLIGAWQTSLSA